MSVKDKIIFGLMVLLIIGGGYIQYSYTEIMKHMDLMDKKQITHVDEVNKEFREDLRKLNLQFIGRGKHLRKAQMDIIANTKLVRDIADSLATMINDVEYQLNELDRDVNKRFSTIEQDIEDINDSFEGERRRNRTRFNNLERDLSLINIRLKEIETLGIIQKEKAKKQENK